MNTKPYPWGATALALCALGASSLSSATEVRFASFNASLNRGELGQLLDDLSNPGGAGFGDTTARRIQQAHNVAEIIQRTRPDVLLVNEFDFDDAGVPGSSSTMKPLGYSSEAARLFQNNFLSAGHGGGATGRTEVAPLDYAYRYTPTTNTGIPSGFDLDNSGSVGGGNDAFGFGNYAGQYGMTIYSKYEITGVRTFQNFLWKDMPNNLLTNDPSVGASNLANYYSPDEIAALRLSSKTHVDLTLNIEGQEVHFLTAHPTPPVFDGAEDRNGKRNSDEIRFWADYIAGADYIYDDAGQTGGLSEGSLFVIAGDYNADPNDGDSDPNAIRQLLESGLINNALVPTSTGGVEAATSPTNNGNANDSHGTPPEQDTADFNDAGPGNLRVDYVLPAVDLELVDAGVFWPTSDDSNFELVGTFRNPDLYNNYASSDHKLVWADVAITPAPVPIPGALPLLGSALVALGWRKRGAKR